MKKSCFLFIILLGCLIILSIYSISYNNVCWGQDLSQFPIYIAPTALPQYPTLWAHTFYPYSYIPGFDNPIERARYVYFTWPGFSVLNSFGLSGIELAYSHIFPLSMTYNDYYMFPNWKVPPTTIPYTLSLWPTFALPPDLW
ncbi:MAG: hypothetical protein ACMUIU_18165 [bacterium]